MVAPAAPLTSIEELRIVVDEALDRRFPSFESQWKAQQEAAAEAQDEAELAAIAATPQERVWSAAVTETKDVFKSVRQNWLGGLLLIAIIVLLGYCGVRLNDDATGCQGTAQSDTSP